MAVCDNLTRLVRQLADCSRNFRISISKPLYGGEVLDGYLFIFQKTSANQPD
jgi:hypothetical protein